MILFFGVLLLAEGVSAATSVSQYGITWQFDKDYLVGQFANGDYWVKTDDITGNVIITRITPDIENYTISGVDYLINGFQVNPTPYGHGFDARLPSYNSNLIPSLPYIASSGDSIIKSISRLVECVGNACRPGIQTVAVLTVIKDVPENNGLTVFRPPYVGNNKPLISTSEIKWNRIPSFPSVNNAPSLDWVVQRIERVQMDHIRGSNQPVRPAENLPFYAADINRVQGDAILRLLLNDSQPEKKEAVIAVIQAGIDYYYFLIEGQTWPRGGGEQPGRILLPLFASYILDNQEMKDLVGSKSLDGNYPYEIETLHRNSEGIVLWGHYTGYNHEKVYWDKLENSGAPGSSTLGDHYRYIDGGYTPGGGYQSCCTSQGFKQTALLLNLVPELKEIFDFPELIEYVDRWVEKGTWTQPDPCAPIAGIRGVDYGPDPNNPGMCILDKNLEYFNNKTDFKCKEGFVCGRFPELHGTNKDGGLRYSNFAASLWSEYRYSTFHLADLNKNNIIELSELNSYVNSWKTNLDISINEVMDAISKWKAGSYI